MRVQKIRIPLYLQMHTGNLVIRFLFSPVVDAGHVYLSILCFLGLLCWLWLSLHHQNELEMALDPYLREYVHGIYVSRLLVHTFS